MGASGSREEGGKLRISLACAAWRSLPQPSKVLAAMMVSWRARSSAGGALRASSASSAAASGRPKPWSSSSAEKTRVKVNRAALIQDGRGWAASAMLAASASISARRAA